MNKTHQDKITDNDKPNTQNAAPEGYILKPEVAHRMSKTTRTIERWMREGILPFIKIGKGRRATVLFVWSDIQERLNTRFGVNTEAD